MDPYDGRFSPKKGIPNNNENLLTAFLNRSSELLAILHQGEGLLKREADHIRFRQTPRNY